MKMPFVQMPKVIAMVLAGGRGERLFPLTQYRAKPAVPFGGNYRIIDFVLSNLFNSGITNIYVLVQYKAHALIKHLQQGWIVIQPVNGAFILPVPAQMQKGEEWYQGTADAVYQNLTLIKRTNPDLVLIFGADHVYLMDVSQMIQFHLQNDAEITIATTKIPKEEASRFGVVVVDETYRVLDFKEKVPNPPTIPGSDECLISMGNYIFNTDVLYEELELDKERKDSSHDFGKDILPQAVKRRAVYAYDFTKNRIKGEGEGPNYWRDVGTIKTYYEANMELIGPLPKLNLYNPNWPIRSVKYHDPPAKVVIGSGGRMGLVENSLLSPGVIVSGAFVRNSIIGRNTRIWSGAVVEDSIILGHCEIEEGAHIHRAIIDHGNRIKAGEKIGYDLQKDREKYFVDPETGLVVIPRNPLYTY
jgi:glucose-1-phosphate adenylyltransferase